MMNYADYSCSYQCKDTNLKAIHNYKSYLSIFKKVVLTNAKLSSESHSHSVAVHAWGVSSLGCRAAALCGGSPSGSAQFCFSV